MIRATTDQNQTPEPPLLGRAMRQMGNPYGRAFWLCYVSNTCVMLAVSLLFRYADFIKFHGGTEFHLGWIVGLGMVGSLLMRIWQAAGIDRYGTRIIWLGSLALFIVSQLGHLFIWDVRSVPIFGLRIIYQIAIAGTFGASITFISRTVPTNRMGEIIGVLGTSGFVGMAFGPWLGDLLFGKGAVTEIFLQNMFIYATVLIVIALITAWFASTNQPTFAARKKPPLWWLVKKYNPGAVLLMGIAIGIGISLPGVFLRTYALSLDIHQLRVFFLTYAFFAFTVRVLTRQLPDQIGYRPMILIGMACMVSSLLLYLLVDAAWMLIIPAVLGGTAHAFLFPSVVASCSAQFPLRHRGLGTTLVLASFDLGTLIGMPLVGEILHYAERFELPAYPTMFIIVAVLLSLLTMIYAIRSTTWKRSQKTTTPLQRQQLTANPHGSSESGSAEKDNACNAN